MKKSLTLFILLCICGCLSATTTYLNFEIEGASEKFIDILIKKPLTSQMNIYKTKLRDNNKTSIALSLEDISIVDIIYDGYAFKLYLRPGDDLFVKFSAQDVHNTMEFTGKGAENNQLLTDYEKHYKPGNYLTYQDTYLPTDFLNTYYNKAPLLSPREYFNWLADEREKQIQFANSRASEVDDELLEYVMNDIEYLNETHKICYFIRNKKKMGPGDFKRVAEHYKLSPIAKKHEDKLLSHPAYVNFIHAYIHYLHLPNDTEGEGVELAYYDLVENNISGRTRCYLMSKLMVKVFQTEGTTDLAKKKFSTFQKECPYPEYMDPIQELYADILIDMPEVDAPDIHVMDESGRMHNLSKYRGKVIYISFWAHWCKPCINNFKKSASLRAQLKKMGVVLLNVSIDNNEDNWRHALETHNIYGTNVWATDYDKVKRQYGLNSIPAYFIVNKKGKFAYLSDEENRDILQEFQDLVNE